MLNLARSLHTAVLRRLSPLALAASAVALGALAPTPAQAVVFSESGDAGQTLVSAQSTSGASGSLTDVFGTLGATNDADLFLIRITNPGSFSAMTASVGADDPDTQLFLFTQAGAPVYANDDMASGLSLLSALPAGSAFGPLTAGLYYLGISLSGVDPVNLNNQLLFATGLSTDTRGPASGLQPAWLAGFDGDGFAPAGSYNIQLTGAAVAAVPEPASALLLLMGGALAATSWARRGRKSQAAATSPISL